MKMNPKSLLVAALIAGLNLLPVGRVTAQTFTTIKSFGILTNIAGFNPQSTLVQGPDGTLYGTATYGEASVAGTDQRGLRIEPCNIGEDADRKSTRLNSSHQI